MTEKKDNYPDDLLLKAVLGPDLYKEVKKYIPGWRKEFETTVEPLLKNIAPFATENKLIDEANTPIQVSAFIPWNDFLNDKIKDYQSMQQYNVYDQDGNKVGTCKAKDKDEAVQKFVEAGKGSKESLTARAVSIMKTNGDA